MENWNGGMMEHWDGGNWTVGTTDRGRRDLRDFVLTFLRIGPRAEQKAKFTFRWFEIPLDAWTKLVDVGSHVRDLGRHNCDFDALVYLYLFAEMLLTSTFAPTVLRQQPC